MQQNSIIGSINKKSLILAVAILVLIFNTLFCYLVFFLFKNYFITIDLDNRLTLKLGDFQISTQIKKDVNVNIDTVISIPLDAEFDIPFSAKIQVNEVFDVNTTIPISLVLTEKELKLAELVIPIETDFPIDEIILVSTTVPIDTTITTYANVPIKVKGELPINISIPIKQNIHIKKTLLINIEHFKMSLDLDLPIKTQVSINQPITASSTVPIKLNSVVDIPIKTSIPVNIADTFTTQVGIDGSLSVKSGTLKLDFEAFGVGEKRSAPQPK